MPRWRDLNFWAGKLPKNWAILEQSQLQSVQSNPKVNFWSPAACWHLNRRRGLSSCSVSPWWRHHLFLYVFVINLCWSEALKLGLFWCCHQICAMGGRDSLPWLPCSHGAEADKSAAAATAYNAHAVPLRWRDNKKRALVIEQIRKRSRFFLKQSLGEDWGFDGFRSVILFIFFLFD